MIALLLVFAPNLLQHPQYRSSSRRYRLAIGWWKSPIYGVFTDTALGVLVFDGRFRRCGCVGAIPASGSYRTVIESGTVASAFKACSAGSKREKPMTSRATRCAVDSGLVLFR
jgi:hypothetical protein